MATEMSPVGVEEKTYCEVHTDRETSLRCNKCNRYMCVDCAVQTPVGYRCKQCVRQHEDKFFNANEADYAIIFVICGLAGALGGFVLNQVHLFWIFIFFLALPIGGAISEAALRATQRRRGRYSGYVAAAGVVAGGLVLVAYLVSRDMAMYAQFAGYPGADVGQPPLLTLLQSYIDVYIFVGVTAFIVYGRYQMKL